jgi:DNA-directed RNA polymerase specialized sigma24 family protein
MSRPDSESRPASGARPLDHLVETYGDLLFDLCESVLWSPANAQLAFRAILKAARPARSDRAYVAHERAWILRLACGVLRPFAERYGRKLAPSEQIMLDSMLTPERRLQQLDSYFHRLSTDDQLLLLLHDKHGLPPEEIASALGAPSGTLQLRRQQALRTLEEWVWNET